MVLAHAKAKPVDPSKIPGDTRIGSHMWEAQPFKDYIDVPKDTAEQFKEDHRYGIFSGGFKARIAFKIRKSRNHKKMAKNPDFPGRLYDYGAGPLIEAKVVAVRIQDSEMILVDKLFEQ